MTGATGQRRDAAVAAYAGERGITEVLHFTTNKGALGIFASGAVKPTIELGADEYLAHIYTQNCSDRTKDIEWTGYVSLSISRVNNWMFSRSEGWHGTEDVWWVVLALDVSLLADPGVYFVTTNNTYTSCLRRGTGANGLRALYAPSVEWGWYGSRKARYRGTPDAWPTDPQAEVLYPGQIPVSQLRAVYVRDEEHADTVSSWFSIFPGVTRIPVKHKPEVFR